MRDLMEIGIAVWLCCLTVSIQVNGDNLGANVTAKPAGELEVDLFRKENKGKSAYFQIQLFCGYEIVDQVFALNRCSAWQQQCFAEGRICSYILNQNALVMKRKSDCTRGS